MSVRVFKSITTKQIFQREPMVKKELWRGEFWTDGYYVATLGERGDWGAIDRYVERHGKPREEISQIITYSVEIPRGLCRGEFHLISPQ